MSGRRSLREAALRLLLRLYPRDFREDVGGEWLASYGRRAAEADAAGAPARAAFWARAVTDSVRNGLGERMNPAVWWRRRGGWGLDMHWASRRLLRAPGFTLATVGTLAVGLGSFAVVWSAVDNVLLEPPSYEEPDDLYFVWRDYRAIFDLDRGWLSGPDVLAFDTAGGVLTGAAAVRRDLPPVVLAPGAPPTELAVMSASGGLFGLLGVDAALGRTFTSADDEPGSPRVAVLGHELWVNEFGARRDVLGRTIRVDGAHMSIVGVMPRGFRFARHGSGVAPATAELYVTFAVELADENPGSGSYAGLVRARPGTPPEAVRTAVERVGQQLDEHYFQGRGIRYFPVPLMADLVASIRPALTVLGAAAAFLVLVLTVNLATLLLGRAAQREREFAVSRALGADGWTLGRAALLEGLLLGLLGAGAALLLALWGTQLLVELAPTDLPRLGEIAVDGSVVASVLLLGAALGILGGAVPAVWASRTRLSDALRQAAVRGGGGHTRMRRGMVVAQVALSLVLLAAGGTLVRSFETLLRADPGFRTEGAVTFRIPVSGPAYDSAAAVNVLHGRVLDAAGALPGVQEVAGLSALPLSGDPSQLTVSFPGAPGNTGQAEHDVPLVDVVTMTEGALGALGVRLLDGEGLRHSAAEPTNEVLIDQSLASTFFPDRSPVGATLLWAGQDSLRVAGVIQQVRMYDLHRDGRGQVWRANAEYTNASLAWVAHTDRPAALLAQDLRTALRQIDPSLPVARVQEIEEVVHGSVRRERLSATLTGGFALGALLLTAMGLFGVVSAAVTRRRGELGIRMALGAEPGQVMRMVVGDGLRLVALGLLIGIPGVLAAGRVLRSVLVGVSPFDGVTLLAVGCALGAVAIAACWIPARGVTRIDPAGSLRSS